MASTRFLPQGTGRVGLAAHHVRDLFQHLVLPLQLGDLGQAFKFQRVPPSAHQCPGLEKRHFVNAVFRQVVRDGAQVGAQQTILHLPAFGQRLTVLRIEVPVEVILPVDQKVLPGAVVVPASFLAEFMFVESTFKTLFFIFSSHLLHQCQPAAAPVCQAPAGGDFYLFLFRRRALQVVVGLLQHERNELYHGV